MTFGFPGNSAGAFFKISNEFFTSFVCGYFVGKSASNIAKTLLRTHSFIAGVSVSSMKSTLNASLFPNIFVSLKKKATRST